MMKTIYTFLLILFLEILSNSYTTAQTGKWTQLFPQNSPEPRGQLMMAQLYDGKVLMFGGKTLNENGDNEIVNETWIFDLQKNNWTQIFCDSLLPPRSLAAMSYIDTGKIILFGGEFIYGENFINYTWMFDAEKMNWEKLFPAKSPYYRDRAISAYLGNKKILLFGGEGCPYDWSKYEDGYCHDTWIFDLNKMEWDSVMNDFPRGREAFQMCELKENEVLLYGGWMSSFFSKDRYQTYIFDETRRNWYLLNPKIENLKRNSSTMVQLQDDITMVFGGDTRSMDTSAASGTQWDNDTWIFNFKDTTWTQLNLEIKPPARYYHQASKISKGKAIIFGGAFHNQVFGDTWLFEYDPTSVKEDGRNNLIDFTQKGNDIEIHLIDNGNYISKIKLYDYMGNLLEEFNSNNQQNVIINIANHPSGAYILQVSTSKYNWNKLFIK